MCVTGVNMATSSPSSEELDKQIDAAQSDASTTPLTSTSRICKNEHILNNNATTMAVKVQALIESWNELVPLKPPPSKESLHTLAQFLLTHTLNVVLSVKWMKYTNKYYALLEQGIQNCMKTYKMYPEFQVVSTKLLSLIKGPWMKDQIREMLHSGTIIPTKKEYDFFVYEESAYILTMRLKKLCEDDCGDMALNLTRCYLKCHDWAEAQKMSMYISENQRKFILDLYLSLLYRYDVTVEMSKVLNDIKLSDGVDLVHRLAIKVPSKVWENHICVAKFSGTIFLTRCVIQSFDEASQYLRELLNVWIYVFHNDKDSDDLVSHLRKIMKLALTAPHMYLFIDYLSTKVGLNHLNLGPYYVEIYIQAINTDLNILERAKTENGEYSPQAAEISQRIADGFMSLAGKLSTNVKVARECVLTAFSLRPSQTTLAKIEEMAVASGYSVLHTEQWNCKRHPPAMVGEDLIICRQCNEFMSEFKLSAAINEANPSMIDTFNANLLGLPSDLCHDLVVIIFTSRYKILNWSQRWRDLQRLCVMYLNNPEVTKNWITELKFVDVDYTPFLLQRQRDLERRRKLQAKRILDSQAAAAAARFETDEDSSESEACFPPVAKIPKEEPIKSDPNVLKTLKSFRRIIKPPRDENDAPWLFPPSVSEPLVPEVLAGLDQDGMSTDGDDDSDFNTSSPTARLLPVNNALHANNANSSLSGTNTQCPSIINGKSHSKNFPAAEEAAKNENVDPQQEQHMQEFRNFQHDAENHKIDRPFRDRMKPNQFSSQYVFEKFVYNIKECSIVLTRCDDRKENCDINANVNANSNAENITLPRYEKQRKIKLKLDTKRKLRRSSSENIVQSQLVKSYNKLNSLHINRKILSTNNNVEKLEALKKRLLDDDSLNPVVLLKRLKESSVQTLLSAVPGMGNDTELFQPIDTDRIVNVVQVAGGRTNPTVQSPNTQTSTQVSPHIQRIGQPRSEKSDETPTTTNKTASTQSSTLINILSQQITRPTNSNLNLTRSRPGPLINIISQSTMKAPVTKTATTVTSEATYTPTQLNNTTTTTRIIATNSEQQQILNQIVNTNRTGGTMKAVVDGKLIPVTSFPSNRLVKVGTNPATTLANIVNIAETNTNAQVVDEFAKLSPACKKTEGNEVVSNSSASSGNVSETLPKFQQAFGKSVYQNNVEGTTSNNAETSDKKAPLTNQNQIKTTTTTVNVVQPIQGGVIYTRQMPIGQTFNLIQQNRGQVFRIATTNADSVMQNKMNVLLAAALQGQAKPKIVETAVSTENVIIESVPTTSTTRLQIARPQLVQSTRIVKPVLQIPATSASGTIAVSNVIRNAPQANLSSTTLEQLREFDMVYKQVKERSSTSTPAPADAPEQPEPQRISVTYLNQSQKLNCAPVVVVSTYSNLQPAASPALSVASQGSSSPCVTPAPTPTPVLPKVVAVAAVAGKSSKGKSVKNPPMPSSKTSPIPKPQQKPQEDEHTAQRIFDILAEYAEQLRNSPDLNNKPAPRRRSNPPTNPSTSSKRKKGSSSSKKSGQCSSLSTEADTEDHTIGSEDSSCGVPVMQLSMQDEEQTPTTASTSESNDSTNHAPPRQLILTDSSHNQARNLIITESSVGEALKTPNTAVLLPGNYIMPVSVVKGGQQIAVVSGGRKILATVPARSAANMLLFQSFLQSRKTNTPSVTYSTIQPISGISSHSLTGVTAQPPVILPPPTHELGTVTLGQPIAIKKIDNHEHTVNAEQLLLTISQSRDACSGDDAPQPDSSSGGLVAGKIVLDESTASARSDHSPEKGFVFQKQVSVVSGPIATPVIAQAIKDNSTAAKSEIVMEPTIMTLNINPPLTKVETMPKTEERVQSVLVTAGTSSNGPMLSHSPPQYKQSDCNNGAVMEQEQEASKDAFLRNGGKRTEKQNTVFCVQGKAKKSTRMDREVQQMCLQRRQAAIERELRLQKSLSEECEDLGVDEPSTSDLFPEALLFDANNSPSFDQNSQETHKRQHVEKEENKMPLFSDDDFIFETSQYDNDHLCYEEVVDSQMLSNGQGDNAGGEGDVDAPKVDKDTTLLQTCTSMSDVTLCSPVSPDKIHTNTSPPFNKYMHKYTNKKKTDKLPRPVDNWSGEVSSSEDTTGSTETGTEAVKRSYDELEELECCAGEGDDLDCSASGRGARKAIKKTCSCCNGSEEHVPSLHLANHVNNMHAHTISHVSHAAHRKRTITTTTLQHKKAFLNKKR